MQPGQMYKTDFAAQILKRTEKRLKITYFTALGLESAAGNRRRLNTQHQRKRTTRD